MDFLAIVSMGAYPTPTPTDTARALFAASWGLLGELPVLFGDDGHHMGILNPFRRALHALRRIW